MKSKLGLKYYGGKSTKAEWIASHRPDGQESMTWVDVFCGGGGVTLNMPPSRLEVLNDLNGEIFNFFTVMRDKPNEFKRVAKYTLHGLDFYKEAISYKGDDDVKRAVFFAVKHQQSYSGQGRSFSRNISPGPARKHWKIFTKKIDDIVERLQMMQVDNLDFEDCIKRYDRPDATFYLDPPYVGHDKDYDVTFTEDDHRRMAKVLSDIKGNAMVSGYGTPLELELYDGWRIEKKKVLVSAMTANNSQGKFRRHADEHLFLNY